MITFPHSNRFEKKDIESVDTDVGRFYKVPGATHLYKSITTVLGQNEEKKKSLNEWRERVGRSEAARITRESARIGTEVHSLLEYYLANDDEKLDLKRGEIVGEANFLFETLVPIVNKMISEVCLQEFPVWSHRYRIAGRCDLLAVVNGKLTIIDFKTWRTPRKEEWIKDYFLQCAAYSFMFEEVYGEPVARNVILGAVRDGEPCWQLFHSTPETFREDGFFRALDTTIQEKSTTYEI